MDNYPVILHLNVEKLQNWILQGIILTHLSDKKVIQLSNDGPEDQGQLDVLVRLPEKYIHGVGNPEPVILLVDEIVNISLRTESLTYEWKTRMHNLGLPWLPFEFKAEWLDVPMTELVALEEKIIPPAFDISKELSAPTAQATTSHTNPERRPRKKKNQNTPSEKAKTDNDEPIKKNARKRNKEIKRNKTSVEVQQLPLETPNSTSDAEEGHVEFFVLNVDKITEAQND